MGRFGSVGRLIASAILSCLLIASLTGCSGGNAVTTTTFPVPASITISPGPNFSLEVGANQAFTVTIQDANKRTIAEPVFFQSSNTAIVTVAANGLACAGTWDSLSNPSICTPGPVGVAQVTATALGVISPPTTVYVHQHIDKVTVSTVPPVPTTPCLSIGQELQYQASAFSRGLDITSTVGVFTWQAVGPGVVTLNPAITGFNTGKVTVTARAPGVTPIFATIGMVNSIPVNFTTCAVQSIALEETNTTANAKNITATVIDTLGVTITKVPLTWSSSEPASVSVSDAGSATASSNGGGASVIASCTPPTCNIGFLPTLPIYPDRAIVVTGNSTGGTQSQSATVYVTSSACGKIDGCVSTVVPVTAPNTLASAIALPATPNSMVIDRQGAKIYLGTNSGLLGSKGLMVLDAVANSVTEFTFTPGKVLAVSPDGSKVIVSDTTDLPNQVFVFDTTSGSATVFRITGATAADFSPDSLKAYIVAGSTLYVYSKLDALQTIPLAAPAKAVSFLAEGAFAYLAGGSPSAVTVRRTCDNGEADTVLTPAVPTFLQTLPDATGVLAVDPPTVDVIHVSASPSGCVPGVSDTVSSINLGHGNFVAKQLIVSQDGSTAYVVADNMSSILVFNIAGETSSSIPLAGNAVPLQASLTPNGAQLYVGANDGTVHVLQTATGVDLRQITFPNTLCLDTAGQAFGITCNPDMVAVRP